MGTEEITYNLINQKVVGLFPQLHDLSVKYSDDMGDKCTLCEASFRDFMALSMAAAFSESKAGDYATLIAGPEVLLRLEVLDVAGARSRPKALGMVSALFRRLPMLFRLNGAVSADSRSAARCAPKQRKACIKVESRRDLLARIAAAVPITLGAAPLAAHAYSGGGSGYAKAGPSANFSGEFDDPNHPNCLRKVYVLGSPRLPSGKKDPRAQVIINGVDNDAGTKSCSGPADQDKVWVVKGKLLDAESASFDFSPKGGPTEVLAKYDSTTDGIIFPDGNKWTKVPGGTPDRRFTRRDKPLDEE